MTTALGFVGRYAILLACLAAFCISIIVTFSRGDAFRHVDERVYHDLAIGILAGKGYVNAAGNATSYRPPGYPLVLAGLYSMWEGVFAAKVLNAIMLGLAAGVCGFIAERTLPRSGWIAAGLVAIYPLFVYTSSTVFPQTLGLFLFMSCLLLMLVEVSLPRLLAAGVLYGFLILAIPYFLLLLPIIAALVFFTTYDTGSRRAQNWAGLFTIFALLVIAPWTARNYVVFSAFIPVATNGGVNLLAGNSPDARPNTGIMAHLRYRNQTRGMSEVERDEFYKRTAIKWIKEDPMRAAQLYAGKFVNYFNFVNEVVAKSEQPGKIGEIVLFVSYYSLLLVVLARIVLVRSVPLMPLERIFLLIYLVNGMLSAVFYTRLRYRLPFDGLLIVLAAIAVVHLSAWVEARWLSPKRR